MNLNNINNFKVEKIDILVPAILFILTFIIYIKFLAPSIFEGDPAEFSIVCYILGIPHPNGYPIYTWIGHIFTMIPVGTVAQRINTMSAFFGAITVSIVYTIVFKLVMWNKKLFKNKNISDSPLTKVNSDFNVYRLIAVIAALSLALSKTFWSQAEIAEVYTLNAFFIALMILILIKWNENRDIKYLYVFFLIYGLSIGAHASNLFFMPAFLLFIALTNYKIFLNHKNSILFISIFMIGLLQFLYVLIRASQHPGFGEVPQSIYEWWMLITAQKFSNHFIISFPKIPENILMYLGFLKANFSYMGLVLGILGVIGLFKNNFKYLILFGMMFFLNVSFYINYYVFDFEVMFIPSFLIFSIFIGIGIINSFDFVKDVLKNYKIGFNPLRNFLKLFLVIILFSSLLVPATSYFTNHGQIEEINNDKFAYFAYTALNEVPSNSTIITYWKSYAAFKYFQIVDKINPNVTIIQVEEDDLLNAANQKINNGNVFVFHELDNLNQNYYLIPFLDISEVGTLYKIEKVY